METQTQAVPLSRHKLVDTCSPDEAREAIGRIFCPHVLIPQGRAPENFHARHHTAFHTDYSVNYVTYTSTVDIDPGELSRFFLLQMPIRGGAAVRCGGALAEVEMGVRASILSPTLPTRMTWHEGCEKIIILIRREALETQFAALTHRPGERIEFATGVDLTTPSGRALSRHVALMLEAAEGGPTPEAYMVALRDGLTTLLLTSLTHSGSLVLNAPAGAAAPKAVRRADAFIAEHADRPISMAEVAAAAGTSLRSLQDAYRLARGLTLTESIRNIRLERFRAMLEDPEGSASVTDIAFTVGFGHLGRAAAVYRARFGETPQQTLRRRR